MHPLLGPELLAALGRMGHGDTLAAADGYYPPTRRASPSSAATASAPTV
ncbi:RbsD/FucU domain-containing protein [Microbispora rosea]